MRLPTGQLSRGKLKSAVVFCVLCGGVPSVFLALTTAAAVPEKAAAPGPAVFEMREVSAFDKNAIQSDLTRGQYAECTSEPDKAVKAYPKLKSKRPLYGKFLFDRDFARGKSIEFHFVLDESGEPPPGEENSAESTVEATPEKTLWQSLVETLTGTAEKGKPAKRAPKPEPKLSRYDRLYIDLNRDLDLTNDPVHKPMKAPPWKALPSWTPQERMAFDCIDVPVDYGPGIGIRPFRILPWLTISREEDHTYSTMHFVATVARQGRIRIGGHAYQALLAQPYLPAGRFDRPLTSLFLKPVDPKEKLNEDGFSGGALSTARWRDGQLYTTSATPLGDKLTVTPYRGEFGIFAVGQGRRSIKDIVLHGSLASETMNFELQSDPSLPRGEQKEVRRYKVPVGDYYPLYLSITYGRLHINVSDNYHSDGHRRGWDQPRNFFVKIRKDQPFTLDFSHRSAVLFASPAKDQRFKPGDEISVKAVLIDPVFDIMVRRLSDTSRKTKETIKLDGGKTTSYERELSLDPIVTITNAAGKKVAEGPMPFG